MSVCVAKSLLLGAALLAAVSLPHLVSRAAAGNSCVDVALVLAVDSSASVSAGEYILQQEGISAAFRDEKVLEAIHQAGRVAVSVVFWGSEGLPKPQSRWMLIDSREAAEEFARTVETMPRQVTGDTGLGAGLLTSLTKLKSLEVCSIRKIINVSGDGEETRAVRGKRRFSPPPEVRDLAETMRVEINALAISNEQEDLAEYYSANVITGPDAFVMQVGDYAGFAQALQRKLIREISPRVVSALPVTPSIRTP